MQFAAPFTGYPQFSEANGQPSRTVMEPQPGVQAVTIARKPSDPLVHSSIVPSHKSACLPVVSRAPTELQRLSDDDWNTVLGVNQDLDDMLLPPAPSLAGADTFMTPSEDSNTSCTPSVSDMNDYTLTLSDGGTLQYSRIEVDPFADLPLPMPDLFTFAMNPPDVTKVALDVFLSSFNDLDIQDAVVDQSMQDSTLTDIEVVCQDDHHVDLGAGTPSVADDGDSFWGGPTRLPSPEADQRMVDSFQGLDFSKLHFPIQEFEIAQSGSPSVQYESPCAEHYEIDSDTETLFGDSPSSSKSPSIFGWDTPTHSAPATISPYAIKSLPELYSLPVPMPPTVMSMNYSAPPLAQPTPQNYYWMQPSTINEHYIAPLPHKSKKKRSENIDEFLMTTSSRAGSSRKSRTTRNSLSSATSFDQAFSAQRYDPITLPSRKKGQAGSSSQEGGRFPCKICPQVCNSKGDLKRHMLRPDHEPQPVFCRGCDKMYTRGDAMSRHHRGNVSCHRKHLARTGRPVPVF